MSGVNGGIDYELNVDALTPALRDDVSYIVSGPDSPAALIESMRRITEQVAAAGAGGDGDDAVVPVLVDSLGYNNPISANMAVDALVNVYGRRAVPTLLRGVAAFNYAVNAYALRALARIGDASVAAVATKCALRGPIPNVRRAAVRCLGALRYDEPASLRACIDDGLEPGGADDGDGAPADGAGSAADAADTLLALLDDSDWTVRYAAMPSLQRLIDSGQCDAARRETFHDQLREHAANDADEAVRTRAVLALQ